MKKPERWPQLDDFVAVTDDNVDYYGYVVDIDFKLNRIKVEFFPYVSYWFGLDEVRFVSYPEDL